MSTRKHNQARHDFVVAATSRIERLQYLANCAHESYLGHDVEPRYLDGICQCCGEIGLLHRLNPFQSTVDSMPRCPYVDI